MRVADDATMLQHAIVENVQREELNPLEEAAAYQQLIEDFSLTHDDVATKVGKSRATITNTLRLLQLPPSIQRYVKEGALRAGHARALLGTPDRAFQEQLAKRVVSDSWMEATQVGDMIVDAIRNNTLYVATHGNWKSQVTQRFQDIIAAMPEADDSLDLSKSLSVPKKED